MIWETYRVGCFKWFWYPLVLWIPLLCPEMRVTMVWRSQETLIFESISCKSRTIPVTAGVKGKPVSHLPPWPLHLALDVRDTRENHRLGQKPSNNSRSAWRQARASSQTRAPVWASAVWALSQCFPAGGPRTEIRTGDKTQIQMPAHCRGAHTRKFWWSMCSLKDTQHGVHILAANVGFRRLRTMMYLTLVFLHL